MQWRRALIELRAALATHEEALIKHGVHAEELLALCDPAHLIDVACRNMARSEAILHASGVGLPEYAELMVDHAFAVRRELMSLADIQLPESTETAAPGTGGSLGGGGISGGSGGGGRPAVGGIFISWKDLDATLWPSYLQIVPTLLRTALTLALQMLATQANFAAGVDPAIQPMIDQGANVLMSVLLVVPPVIVPNFSPPKGMPAIALTRYEETLILKGRLFMLGVPIGGRVKLHPATKPAAIGGSSVWVSEGRPLTAAALLTQAGLQQAQKDYAHVLHQLGPQILKNTVQTICSAFSTIILSYGKQAVVEAIKALDLESAVGTLAKDLKQMADTLNGALGTVPQGLQDLVKQIDDDFGASIDPVHAREWAAEKIAGLQNTLINTFYEQLYSLAGMGVMTSLKTDFQNQPGGGIKTGDVQDGFGKAIQPGWWVRIGDTQEAKVASVQKTGPKGQEQWTVTFDRNVTAPSGTVILAYPQEWDKDPASRARLDMWMAISKGAERAQDFVSDSLFNALVGKRIDDLQQALQKSDPQQQQKATQQTLQQWLQDMGTRGLFKTDFDQFDKGLIVHDVVRPIGVAAGDKVVVDTTKQIATWTFADGDFTSADEKTRSLHVTGTANPLDSGDFQINRVIDAHTVETSHLSNLVPGSPVSLPLGSESFDPTKVAVQVAIVYREHNGNEIHKLEDKAVTAATKWVAKTVESTLTDQMKQQIQKLAPGVNLADIDLLAKSAGGHTFTEIVQGSATSIGNDVGSLIKAANPFDVGGNLQQIGNQLQTTASKVAQDLDLQLYNLGNGAVRELFARLFIFTCVVGFDISGGIEGEAGGFLADWSGNLFIDNRIESCVADGTTNGGSGNGGAILLKGALPNMFLLNELVGNSAEQGDGRGGGMYCDDGAWPLLLFNDVKNNVARFGGGLDFAARSMPIALFNDVHGNIAHGSGLGGGIRAECFFGFLLFNSLRNNSASSRGGGLHLDGHAWAFFNDIKGNSADELGGGLCVEGGGDIAFNDILGNHAAYGGGVGLTSGPDLSSNCVRANRATSAGGGYALLGWDASPTICDEVENNYAPIGGGAYIDPDARPDFAGCELLNNVADREGGGVYLDGRPGARVFSGFSGTNLSANKCGVRGGGIFALRDLDCGGSFFVGNTAVTAGGGLYAANRGRIRIRNTFFYANMAGEGGGAATPAVQALELANAAFCFNLAISGDGGGLLAETNGTIEVSGSSFTRNGTHGGSGGGACVRGANRLSVHDSAFSENATHLDGDPIATSPPGGGGVAADHVVAVDVEGVAARRNGSERGGAFAFLECAQVRVSGSTFTSNVADLDRDGAGLGGALFATGRGTLVRVGGSRFSGNTAGTPGSPIDPTREGNGGAIAIVDGAAAVIEANEFTGNSATDDGGAVYFRNSGPGSRLGGENRALLPSGRRLGNVFHENCEVERIHVWRERCCIETLRPPTWTGTGGGTVDETPPPVAMTDAPHEHVTETPDEYVPPHTPEHPPCVPWVTYTELVFNKAPAPARPSMRRRIDWIKPVQASINDAFNKIPLQYQLLLLLVAPDFQTDFTIYTLWPSLVDLRAKYDVGTDTTRFLPGWAPQGDFRALNVAGSGWGYSGGEVDVRDDVHRTSIGWCVARRGGAFAIVGGEGVVVLGNAFSRNYAAQLGGAGLVDGADDRTVIGPPSSAAAFGRNELTTNFAALGGALALVGGTRARVVWNLVGGDSRDANYALGGAGIFMVDSSPTIGGRDFRETVELRSNVAGHLPPASDAHRFPALMASLSRAGLVGFGGGIAAVGRGPTFAPQLNHLIVRDNVVVRPKDIDSFLAGVAPSPPPPQGLAAAPSARYFVGGGIALLCDCRARVADCMVVSNEVAPEHHDELVARVVVAGGGLIAGFDAPVPPGVAPPRGCRLERVAIEGSRVRIQEKGLNAGEQILLGGGAAFLESIGALLDDSSVRGCLVMRQHDHDEPHAGQVSLRGGGIALDGTTAVVVSRTRVEDNVLSDPDVPHEARGGGVFCGRGSSVLQRSWVVRNSSHRDGGGIALIGPAAALKTPARHSIIEVTCADNDAISRGGALYAGGDLAGSVVSRSIFDSYAGWDSPAAWGGSDLSTPALLDDCCVWAPLHRGAIGVGGSLTADPAQRLFAADPGFVSAERAVDPDYELRAGSPCLGSAIGVVVGWHRHPSTLPYQARRYDVPSAALPTLAAALAAALPGDVIDVLPGRYREILDVPDGVVLRSQGGPTQTFLELPLQQPPPRVHALVTLGASRRRAGVGGFSIVGIDPVPLPAVPLVWTGVRADVGLHADIAYQGTLTQLVVYWWKTGIEIGTHPMKAPHHPTWLAGNTVVRCQVDGIRIIGREMRGMKPPRQRPCRAPEPPEFAPVEPPEMPMIEHCLVIHHLQTGIAVQAAAPLPATRIAFTSLRENARDFAGVVPDAIRLDDNNADDPRFKDVPNLDFALQPATPSTALAANATDQRFRGALD